MPEKLKFNFIKEKLEFCGYELLSSVYENANKRLKYKCPKGHIHSIKWSDWQQGAICISRSYYGRYNYK